MDQIKKLQELDCSKVKRFSFDRIETYARVENIYDGDTITIIFEWKNTLIKTNIRLDGIDAPELHSDVETERNVCLKGIDILNQMIGNKVVRVIMGKMDKYGRVLSIVYNLDNININQYLLDYNYVRAYKGGKKREWSQSELEVAGTKSTKQTSITTRKTRISI